MLWVWAHSYFRENSYVPYGTVNMHYFLWKLLGALYKFLFIHMSWLLAYPQFRLEETVCCTMWVWGHPQCRLGETVCCTMWVWGHPQCRLEETVCCTMWVWGHPQFRLGETVCCTMWVWGHPYSPKRQCCFLAGQTSWMWPHPCYFETNSFQKSIGVGTPTTYEQVYLLKHI